MSIWKYLSPYRSNYSKVAAFDLDGTLITTATGRMPWNVNDECDYIFIPGVIEKLRDLSQDHTIVIFSNQLKFNEIKKKLISNVIEDLEIENIYPYVYVSMKNDENRKPKIGMWLLFKKDLENDVKDVTYCGDAAGEESRYITNQWGDTDKIFAKNMRAKFLEPQELFKSTLPKLDYRPKHLIIMIGAPGTGKSTISEELEKIGYTIVSKDSSKNKFLRILKEAIHNNESIVIDNTNGKEEDRLSYIEMAHDYSYEYIWCLGNGREFNKRREKKVPEIAYNVYSKNFIPPRRDEQTSLVYFS